ncbi:kinase-like protein [Heliocybe sulcata]|uniref:Kinase-like protein n=1 Tax=Heliocybe sulcata TaxID=5364 RepID=A0A5C3MVY3_9AGAM|nr:kinase-like protein [Heliocybe sulcata]
MYPSPVTSVQHIANTETIVTVVRTVNACFISGLSTSPASCTITALDTTPSADTYIVKELGGDKSVCEQVVKHVRCFKPDLGDFSKAVAERAAIWASIQHPNIVPLTCRIRNDLPAHYAPLDLVTLYCPRRNIITYIKEHSDVELLPLVAGIADGLGFLHSHDIVHGSVHKSNVLIHEYGKEDSPVPLLTDVGLAIATGKPGLQCPSPEACEGKDPMSLFTKEADVYAFGMLLYEMITGKPPFLSRYPAPKVCLLVGQGRRPSRPERLSAVGEQLWPLVEECWTPDPAQRPTMVAIRQRLAELMNAH